MLEKLIDNIHESWSILSKNTVDSLIDLECCANPTTIASNKGSLMSVIRVDGTRGLAGVEEFGLIKTNLAKELNGPLSEPGHAIQIVYSREPVIPEIELELLMEPARSGALVSNLNLADVLDDRESTLVNFLSEESLFICCWSHTSILNKEEIERNKKMDTKASEIWPYRTSKTAQDPFAASEVLKPQHEGFVQTVLDALAEEGKGLEAELLSARAALLEVRKSIRPEHTSPEWNPYLYGDPPPMNEVGIGTPDDLSPLLWPRLSHQLCDTDFEMVNSQMIAADGRIWAPIDMTRAPVESRPFNDLVRRLQKQKVPFRISFLLEGGGEMNRERAIANFLRFTNSGNRILKDSIDSKHEAALRGEAIVRFRCSLATWAPRDQKDQLRRNIAHLERSVQGWGRSDVTTKTGDPLEALFSSALGIACKGTGTAALATLPEAINLLPLQRPATPSNKGTHIFRSKDGKPWPYSPDTGLSPFIFDLIHGKPGMGKSVLQNSMALSSLLDSKADKLPFMAILDIGRSSSGFISLLKEALPPNRQHEAEHIRMVNDKTMAVNPHDTQLGFRKPMPSESSYLSSLYGLLVTGPNEELSPDMDDLIFNVIKEMYRVFSDEGENVDPRKYSENTDPLVSQALETFGFIVDVETTWWEVVDYLFKKNEIRLASRAQRFAVPILADASRAANNDRVKNLFKNTLQNGENIVDVFTRRINTAAGKYPILSRETFFDLGSTRICALDLADVTTGTSKEDQHKSAIFYMFARHVLVHHWWFEEDMISHVPKIYRSWHQSRIKSLLRMSKRLCYDEFHRTGNTPIICQQLIRDVRETRKMNVQISVATQMLEDFTKEMIGLASGIWVLGLGVDEDQINVTIDKFKLNKTADSIIRHDLGPPDREGATVLHISSAKKGRYEQLLYNSLGARELWALTTDPENVSLRDELTSRVGAPRARELLAKNYPSASATDEINRIMEERMRQGETKRATKEVVSAELATKMEMQ